jgi:hypothetical protein
MSDTVVGLLLIMPRSTLNSAVLICKLLMKRDSDNLNIRLYCDIRNPLNITFEKHYSEGGHGIEA